MVTVPFSEDGIIYLSGDSSRVTFSFEESTGDIASYAFDSDIFSDSDGDGIIDNDIDNKNDISYTSGTYFTHLYKNTGIPSRAVLTVISKNGEKSSQGVTIMFDEGEKKEKEGGKN